VFSYTSFKTKHTQGFQSFSKSIQPFNRPIFYADTDNKQSFEKPLKPKTKIEIWAILVDVYIQIVVGIVEEGKAIPNSQRRVSGKEPINTAMEGISCYAINAKSRHRTGCNEGKVWGNVPPQSSANQR